MKIISINKPKGWTSFQVINFLKKKFKENKVGHLGTLDPIATGVLPIFMGKATKLIHLFNEVDKTYRTVCMMGVSTDTYDSEGKVVNTNISKTLNIKKLKNILESFLGEQKQLVPPFSAAKVNGKPFYKLARKGIATPKKVRNIIFHELKIEKIQFPYVQIFVRCSKGTYIRSMINDLGIKLGIGSHMTSLERLACGNLFNTKNSISINKLNNLEKDNLIPWISPLTLLKHYNTIDASSEIVSLIKFGRKVKLFQSNYSSLLDKTKVEKVSGQKNLSLQIKVLDDNQNLIAIGHLIWDNEECYFQPSKVFI